jgi:hypothetical protein
MTVSSETPQAWQRQALEAARISLDYLRHRTGALRRRALLRNGFEYVTGVAGVTWVLWSQWDFIIARPMFTSGIFMWIAGVAYIMWQWHRRAGAQQPAAALGTLDAAVLSTGTRAAARRAPRQLALVAAGLVPA